MASRLRLQQELEQLLGSENVYFQPPSSFLMKYPCIRYKLSGADTKKADNRNYSITNRYELTVIDKNPDAMIHLDILKHFNKCRFVNAFQADNLNHYVLELYY